MTARIAPAALHARLRENREELALLDVRPAGAFARGHILLAGNAPLDRLEIEAPRLVPRRAAPVVLCAAGDGSAERAAATLARFGYQDLAVLEGGPPAWQAAGFLRFEGVYVPSKAFGEHVEAVCGTPHIDADELARLQAAGENPLILDSRPLDEYRQMNIPGGIDVPGAELVHRIHDLAQDPERLIVVNCAGRTRSIIGAQSLINAGVPNRVVALENGTMGWTLAGHPLEHAQTRVPPGLSAAGRAWAREAAARVGEMFGVPLIDHATLARWRAEAETTRTLYLCDVRSPAEYAAGHLPGALSTPGGQLVQATDAWLGTHGARVVLVDDDGVRATMTASWLLQIGRWDVHVLEDGLGAELETGPERTAVLRLEGTPAALRLDADALAALTRGQDVQILDLADSRSFRAGHVPGARRVRRGQLAADLEGLPPAPAYVLTSEDGLLARLALPEATRLLPGRVRVLTGGTEAWRASGRPLEAGTWDGSESEDDAYLRPYDRPPGQVLQAMRDYLRWETALVPAVERDGTLRFKGPAARPDR